MIRLTLAVTGFCFLGFGLAMLELDTAHAPGYIFVGFTMIVLAILATHLRNALRDDDDEESFSHD
jgi:hypothetical protein